MVSRAHLNNLNPETPTIFSDGGSHLEGGEAKDFT